VKRRLKDAEAPHSAFASNPSRLAANPWAAAETMTEFLAGDDDLPAALYERFLYPATVTEIFSPRGIGKSLFAAHVFATLLRQGKRVLLIDRDNPRHVVKARLRASGVAETADKRFRIITREKCPPLTNGPAWALFPYSDYDVVILDSFDSLAEGVGEQDSAKPSRAIAPVLDIARRENGPAVLVLGNCVRSAAHSRGSGVVEDRADIVYEVRDATEFHPTGGKVWVEELPPSGADSWASRSSRRKQREKYRLAFVASKFRIGQEPEPFIMEINTTNNPWTVSDVTDEVDREGAETRQRKADEKAARLKSAAEKLKAEITRRAEAGESPMRKRQDAEPYLMAEGLKLKRKEARELLSDRDGKEWTLQENPHDKREIYVLALGKNIQDGHVSTITESAKTQGSNGANCGPPHPEHTATFDLHESREQCRSGEAENVAKDSSFSTEEAEKKDTDAEVI